MKKILSNLILFSVVITVLLLSCTKASVNERRIDPPPADTTKPPVIDTTDTVIAKKWWVSTFAGADSGKADGDSIYARFYYPHSVCFDAAGILYASDLNFNVRKITAAAHVTTYAGRDISTPDPVYGNLLGIAVDKQGSLFVVEGNEVRKITNSGVVSVHAGGVRMEIKDGPGEEASFVSITRLAIDKDDNLYMCDTGLDGTVYIRKVAPDGYVTTIPVIDNTGVPDLGGPQIYWNCAITVAKDGTMYRTSGENKLIKKITKDGNVSIFAGSETGGLADGQGAAARFAGITDMITDTAGNIYLSDGFNSVVRMVTPGGLVTTIAGTGEQGYQDGEGTQAKFHINSGIAISKEGVLCVADGWNHRIRKLEYK